MSETNYNNRPQAATDANQTRAYAGYYGLWLGLCWVISFGLNMASLQSPSWGTLGLLVGVLSLPLGVRLLRSFRDQVGPLPLRRAWYLSWMMFLAAALICTAAQYIYFAYIDNGLLVRSYTEMLQQPEAQDMLSRMLPGQDTEAMMNEALSLFAATPPSQLAIQFLFWNVLLATIVAFPVALLGKQTLPPTSL